jgi:outer membrane protein, heavy metal efflux system
MAPLRRAGLACASLVILLAGCTGTPRQDTAHIDGLITARGGQVPAWQATEADAARVSEMLREPLTLQRAVDLAFLRNPQIRATYAEIGIAQADLLEASRPRNPRVGYVSLEERGSGASQVTRSVSLGFADLLLLPSRARMARAEMERSRERVGSALLGLEAQVKTAWFEHVGALQVAEMRRAVSAAAAASAEFAQRLRDAGNLPEKQLALEVAAATEARVAASRARADAVRSRASLAGLLGVSLRESWEVPKQLPALPPSAVAQDDLRGPTDASRVGIERQREIVDNALATRLDVSAARREVDVFSGALGLTRRWRWLGDVEVGYERESETDGARLRGPSLAVEVPIFNQNQSGVLRAQSELEAAQARLSALELSVSNDVAAGLDRLESAREIAEAYRTALIPQRETIVARTQEEANYMLAGTFELIQARREEFDAYQEYLEAVRDYWTARTELRRLAGGALPGDEMQPESTVGVDAVLEGAQP